MEPQGEGASPRSALVGLALITASLALPASGAGLAGLHGIVPLVVMYYLATLGWKQGGALMAAGLVLAGAITLRTGSLPALFFAMTLVPVGLLLAHGARKNEPPGLTGLKAVLVLGSLWLLAAAWYGFGVGSNPYRELQQGLEQGFQQTLAYYQAKTGLPAETLQELTAALEATRRFLARALPAVLTSAVIFTVWLNMLAGCWLLKKTRPDLVRWPEFRTWRLPEPLVWLVIVALGLMVSDREPLATIGLNAAYVLGLLYFMQGLAIVAHFLARWQMPRFFRGMVYALLLIQFYGMLLLAIIGLADTWLALRSKPEQPTATT
ncbi:MAG: YybS family protein [Thermodesulfobacteriota bacterium]